MKKKEKISLSKETKKRENDPIMSDVIDVLFHSLPIILSVLIFMCVVALLIVHSDRIFNEEYTRNRIAAMETSDSAECCGKCKNNRNHSAEDIGLGFFLGEWLAD